MSKELTTTTAHSLQDLELMGEYIAKCGLFGAKTKEQAIALCLLAQAEGKHPAIAATEYDIIQGKPARKSDAMLARFQESGGRVKWNEYTDERVSATFYHPATVDPVTIDWDMKRAAKAGLASKDMWRKYPRQMLRARVVSEAIKTVFPGASIGIYAVEEVQDFTDTIEVVAKPSLQVSDIPKLEVQDFKSAIETCKNIDELQKVWADNWKSIKSHPQIADLTALKDEKKKSFLEMQPQTTEEAKADENENDTQSD